MRAGRAKVRGESEAPFDERQPIEKVFRSPCEQKVRFAALGARPGAIEAAIDQTSIEYLRRRRMRHSVPRAGLLMR
jgi:hypothetical protein